MEFLIGFLLIILGGACGGSFGLPAKFAPKDLPWETLWGPFLLFASLLVPLVGGVFLVEGCFALYAQMGITALLLPLLCGAVWGIGSILFGICFAFVGLSLIYAFNCGGQIIFGTLAPLFVKGESEILATFPGIVIITGVVVALIGVVVSGRAGALRAKSQAQASTLTTPIGTKLVFSTRSLFGMFLAFLSGLFAAFIAIGMVYNAEMIEIAQAAPYNNQPWQAAVAAMFLVLMGGAVTGCAYSGYRLTANKTWGRFATPSGILVIIIALVMAIIHDAAVVFFAIGATSIGVYGVSLGYAVFMSFGIIFGNINGFLTGEWKGASRASKQLMLAAICILIISSCIIGYANGLLLNR